MSPTISAEGSDSFDALSRSYSYVYQAPWHYVWYTAVAVAYGAVVVFFVGLMGSLIVFLGEWGVSQAPFMASADPARDRQPTYLFVWAPTSFGWRDVLLHGSQHAEPQRFTQPSNRPSDFVMTSKYMGEMKWYNYVGAFLVSVWLYLLFLLIVGFGYSFFWSASTIIYFLMRNRVDDTDLDEVHLEEEETEEPFGKDAAAPGVATPAPAPTGNVTMVEAPTLRGNAPPPAPPAPVTSASVSPTSAPPTSATSTTAATPAATTAPEGMATEHKPSGDGTPPANPS
jgi:hypothetical protein